MAVANLTVQGRNTIEELRRGDMDKVVQRFDPALRSKLDEGTLRAVWQSVINEAGPLLKFDVSREEPAGPYRALIVTCIFNKGRWEARLVFDGDGRMTGLWLAPEPSPWSPPAYADPRVFTERPIQVGAAPALDGRLTIPQAGSPFAAVVLVHGSGPQDQDETVGAHVGANKIFKDLAWGLATRRIAVLRYNKRTKQHPESLPSAYTLDEEVVLDACAALRKAADTPEIDPERVFLAGHSAGAALAARIARHCGPVAGLILLAGSTRPIDQIFIAQYRYLLGKEGRSPEEIESTIQELRTAFEQAKRAGAPVDEIIQIGNARAPRSYWLDLLTYNPIETAASLGTPMLVLHGGRDYQVTHEDFQGWKAALSSRSGDVIFKIFPSLNHHFIAGTGESMPAEYQKAGHVAVEVIEEISRWVATRRRMVVD